MSNNLARVSGLMETDVAVGSGLAHKHFRVHCVSNQTYNVNVIAIGGAGGAAVTAWTAVTLLNPINPFSTTLVAQVIQGTPVTGSIRLRIRGYNQFHEYQEELTPLLSVTNKTNLYIYLAYCWAHITSVEYQSTGLNVANATLSLGQRWDWTRTIDASNDHQAGRNLGIPLFLRSGRIQGRVFRGGTTSGVMQQRIGPTIVGPNTLALGGEQTYRLERPRDLFPERVAFASLQSVSGAAPANNDTVTIDGKVYTFKTAITSADGDVLIGGSGTIALQNLRYAINQAGGQAGVTYGANTTRHTTVKGDVIHTVGADVYLQINARVPGTYGGTITLAESSANLNWVPTSATPGTDAPMEIQQMTVWDLTGQASAGAITHQDPTTYAIGLNADGWKGPQEKVHLYSNPAQWATADNIMVTTLMLSADAR